MQFPLCILLAIIGFGFIMVHGNESALCKIWNKIEKSLTNEDFVISCTKSSNCDGLNCSGVAHAYNVSSRIQLHTCENPPYVEFEVNVPKLNVNSIKKKIYHNDSIHLTRNLNIEFNIQRNNQMLKFGLFVNFLNNGSFPLLRVPLRIPIISSQNFPLNCSLPEETTMQSSNTDEIIPIISSLPTKSFLIVSKGVADDGYSNCSITNSTCSEEEICQQISVTKPDGICVCISNYTRNEDGKCVLHNETVDNSSVSLLLTAILVPIFVVLIIVAAVYITIRFRVFQHLRRRLRVQVYEHVLLGEDEDEDVTNPVA